MSGRMQTSAGRGKKEGQKPPEHLPRRSLARAVVKAPAAASSGKERAGSKERSSSKERAGNLTPERIRVGSELAGERG
jgi:hypothetical protein